MSLVWTIQGLMLSFAIGLFVICSIVMRASLIGGIAQAARRRFGSRRKP